MQDLLKQDGQALSSKVLTEGGHFYVCGDVTMAQEVGNTLEKVLELHGGLGEQAAAEYVLMMKVQSLFSHNNL